MNTELINSAIDEYVSNFDINWSKEQYKWVAAKCFQDKWDINATDFAAMVEQSLAKTDNLLSSAGAFPRSMIIEFAKVAPNETRDMFRNLFDEEQNLITRYNDFIKSSEAIRVKYNKGKWHSHFQNTNVVSTYLWLRYPEKYYIYKYSVYKKVDTKLEFSCGFKANGEPSEMAKGFELYNQINEIILKHDKLVNVARNHIGSDPKYYSDPQLRAITFDFGFWVSNYYNEPTANSVTKAAQSDAPHYWLFAPGDNASMWDRCREEGVMCIGWDIMGDLTEYKSKKEIQVALKIAYKDDNNSFRNDTHALWQFVHEVKPGDIVYAKHGTSQVIGRGIVEGEYEYEGADVKYPNVRKVRWTNFGIWEHPGKAVLKTLTDITKYDEYVKKLEAMINGTLDASNSDNKRYWWLVANPKIWSMADLAVGKTVEYSLFNDKGKQRRIFQNFLDAKAGDVVIGYESTPRKQVVAFAEISRANDGKTIEFAKTESLQFPIDYYIIKETKELSQMQFLDNPQGSFFALTEEEFDCLYDIIRDSNPAPQIKESSAYSKEDFLREVFMHGTNYDKLVKQLRIKKNIILQGAPGVGKTFIAKRLAYSMLGVKDDSCVEMVQFHQNYTYEDFIQGYKPTADGGFRLETGKFYNFCKVAKANSSKDYFFIIDEINRGNLSKIFGELLMLIENMYRNSQMKLAYSPEPFCVPENLYIIGMMNTTDRSLAMIDYALRRRFSFFDINPGFDTEGFKTYQKLLNSEIFNRFIDGIKQLNLVIANDDSLGSGFCIGHSYFCEQKTFDKDWLENVLEFDIAPMIKEYWFDDNQKYETQITLLRNILK